MYISRSLKTVNLSQDEYIIAKYSHHYADHTHIEARPKTFPVVGLHQLFHTSYQNIQIFVLWTFYLANVIFSQNILENCNFLYSCIACLCHTFITIHTHNCCETDFFLFKCLFYNTYLYICSKPSFSTSKLATWNRLFSSLYGFNTTSSGISWIILTYNHHYVSWIITYYHS